jgi:hypothetical protein
MMLHCVQRRDQLAAMRELHATTQGRVVVSGMALG